MNRDEFYDRKSKSCHYWKKWPTIIGGLDLQSGSLGTWLAMSIKGKVGMLLNIQEKTILQNVESRGVLVANYLIQDTTAAKYVQNLIKEDTLYEGHHLLLFDIKKTLIKISVLTTTNQCTDKKIIELKDGIHGLSNSPMEKPFRKVLCGKNTFKEIVRKHGTTANEETLVTELLNLLKSEHKEYPDDILFESKRGILPPAQIEKLSSVFVTLPEAGYGTRTHTIILVDSNNKMIIREYNKPEEKDSHSTWTFQKFEVQLHI